MAYLGRRGASAALTSADIPDDSITAAKIVDGAVDFQNELGFIENKATTQNLTGTYSTERMYLNDSYTLTGDVTVTGHLALGSIADEDIVITQDGTERTITGSGTLESGELLSSKQTDVAEMTGTLANSVQDNVTRLGTVTTGTFNGTLDSTTFSGDAGKKTATAWVNFDASSFGVRSSFNVSTVGDGADEIHKINFITPMLNTNYMYVAVAEAGASSLLRFCVTNEVHVDYLRIQGRRTNSVTDQTIINHGHDFINVLIFEG